MRGEGWAEEGRGQPSQLMARGFAAIRPLTDLLPQVLHFPACLSPGNLRPCQEKPPSCPPSGGGARGDAGGDLERLENSGGFFSLRETPLTTSPARSTQVSLGLGREGLSWGTVRAWLHSSPAEFEERRVRNQTGAGPVRKKEFCPSHVRSPRASESSVSRLSFSRCP